MVDIASKLVFPDLMYQKLSFNSKAQARSACRRVIQAQELLMRNIKE